jgi:hypothetical protein
MRFYSVIKQLYNHFAASEEWRMDKSIVMMLIAFGIPVIYIAALHMYHVVTQVKNNSQNAPQRTGLVNSHEMDVAKTGLSTRTHVVTGIFFA